jgi:hypothetical protein
MGEIMKTCSNCYYTDEEPICLHPTDNKGEITESFVCENWKSKDSK